MTLQERMTRLTIGPLLIIATAVFWMNFRHGPIGHACLLYLTSVIGPAMVTFELVRTASVPERKRHLLYMPLLLGIATAGIAMNLVR